MLTGEMIYTNRSGRYIKPCFIRTTDAELLTLAENLLTLCRNAAVNSLTRRTVEENFAPFRTADNKLFPVNALLKLLDERFTRSVSEPETNYMQKRRELFSHSSKLLKEQNFDECIEHIERVLP